MSPRLESCPTGRNAASRIFIVAFLALLFSLAQTPAEVRTDSVAGNEFGRAAVAYFTRGGVTASQSRSGSYTYDPDGLPGHQFFRQDLSVSVSGSGVSVASA